MSLDTYVEIMALMYWQNTGPGHVKPHLFILTQTKQKHFVLALT